MCDCMYVHVCVRVCVGVCVYARVCAGVGNVCECGRARGGRSGSVNPPGDIGFALVTPSTLL